MGYGTYNCKIASRTQIAFYYVMSSLPFYKGWVVVCTSTLLFSGYIEYCLKMGSKLIQNYLFE